MKYRLRLLPALLAGNFLMIPFATLVHGFSVEPTANQRLFSAVMFGLGVTLALISLIPND